MIVSFFLQFASLNLVCTRSFLLLLTQYSTRRELFKTRSEKSHVFMRTGAVAIGQVRRVGQVGQVSWYAECHSTTIKPAGFARAKNSADW
jgi:hypothetical protein